MITSENGKITPQEVVKKYANNGTLITIEEAQLVIDFLYQLGKLAFDIVLKQDK